MKRTLLLCFAVVILAVQADAQGVVYLRSNTQSPWNLTGNEDQMDNIFGAGNWQDLRYETASAAAVFSSANAFVFMEGGDSSTDEMETFLNANLATITAWVNAGGCLLLNAAPNEGDGFTFGTVTTVTGDNDEPAVAVNPSHEIFQGPATPVGTSWTGDSFNHGHITGSGYTAIIEDDDEGDVVLAEMTMGAGHVVIGTLTLPFFTSDNSNWLPQPEVTNLHENIIRYASSACLGAVTAEVPALSPLSMAGLALLLAGVAFVVLRIRG